jgi:hypothetical protein
MSTHVENNSDVARLPRKTRARAATHNGGAEFSTNPNRSHNVVFVQRKNHAQWDLSIVRRVRGEDAPRSIIELDLTSNSVAQRSFELEA